MDQFEPVRRTGNSAERVGIDTGGTFTDFVWLDGDGRLQIYKHLSTPTDPSQAVLAGLATQAGPPEAMIVHGSTVATNALLERRGARTALITTAGFRDVLAIGRQNRPELYALVPTKPEPLVPKTWRFEVDERVTAQGEILKPLDISELDPIFRRFSEAGIESVAVCLLFSFLRPEHERRIRQVMRAYESAARETRGLKPDREWHISLSSEILPEFREYERTSTTVINAYVAPLMSRYLNRLAVELAPRALAIMQSNGGIISAKTAGNQAARTVLSGPAGGVVGGQFVAGQAGFSDIITFDMGGTSTDVALCPGRLPLTGEGEIAGMPLRLPMIDIHTVGAGGGSLAYLDPGGALHVGPQSAGADPGPACYGRWPETDSTPGIAGQATVTDANLILGRLDAEHFLGGQMRLEVSAATRAVGKLAEQMGGTLEEAAWSIIQVANINMEAAIRRISVERGYDPRLFTLVAFGGAGPLHACELAENLLIPRVFVPAVPGVLSALGMLVARPTKDYSQTVMKPLAENDDDSLIWLEESFADLERRALAEMQFEGFQADEVSLIRRLDMRYIGQSHELTVTLPPDNKQPMITSLFHEEHERRYSYQRPEAPVEVVHIRLVAAAQSTLPALPREEDHGPDASQALLGRKPVWFNQKALFSLLFQRELLKSGNRFYGPAVVFQYDTTTVIPPGWQAKVDGYGNLILTSKVSS